MPFDAQSDSMSVGCLSGLLTAASLKDYLAPF
jgi:hypothetical protein